MKTYRVIWEIDIDAETAREAAEKARAIQLDPNNTATVFKVQHYREKSQIDLIENENNTGS